MADAVASSRFFVKEVLDSKSISESLLVEVAWEVCNQVGGIYTVIRSKTSYAMETWGGSYCLVGPYVHPNVSAVFDPVVDEEDPFYLACKALTEAGYEAHYGVWLVTGRPKVALFNPASIKDKLPEIRYFLWKNHYIPTPDNDQLVDSVLEFGHLVFLFFMELCRVNAGKKKIIGHFHEWMAATPIPKIRFDNLPVTMVFTTHATLAGRYIAMNDKNFYDKLGHYNWETESHKYNIDCQVKIERAAAHGAQTLSTVSEVTANECAALLGRRPDIVLPNGLNIERFTALHEFQNLHHEYKVKIHQFVMGHFFQNTKFDLDNTIYFFTSGRFEFHNKGFDLTLEALAKLNWMLKQYNSDKTVVMFFITQRPFTSINPQVLETRALMEELRQTCLAIQKQVGDKLFYVAASGNDTKLPPLNDFVEDYWKLRFRRTLLSWKSNKLPEVVTHNLNEKDNDPLLQAIHHSNMLNRPDDRVKIVYHPDFISSINPLFGMDYHQFVRGCHLGIFPSYYEPWGYTPLECVASGIPAVTSDLSGFGDYVLKNMPYHEENGIFVINRHKKSYDTAASQLAYYLFSFLKMNRRERIELRNKVDSLSVHFDWQTLYQHYLSAYKVALERG